MFPHNFRSSNQMRMNVWQAGKHEACRLSSQLVPSAMFVIPLALCTADEGEKAKTQAADPIPVLFYSQRVSNL